MFYAEIGSCYVEQVAQGGCGCPIPGGIQGQAGCDSGQPGLVVGDPAHSRGVETWWYLRSFSAQAILCHGNFWHKTWRGLLGGWKCALSFLRPVTLLRHISVRFYPMVGTADEGCKEKVPHLSLRPSPATLNTNKSTALSNFKEGLFLPRNEYFLKDITCSVPWGLATQQAQESNQESIQAEQMGEASFSQQHLLFWTRVSVAVHLGLSNLQEIYEHQYENICCEWAVSHCLGRRLLPESVSHQ